MSDANTAPLASAPSPWVDHYRRNLILIYVGTLFFFLLLGFYEWRQIGRYVESLALERGRVLFSLIELTRDWNALHGGVYVPVTPATQPNPYLQDDPTRDVNASDDNTVILYDDAGRHSLPRAAKAEVAQGIVEHLARLLAAAGR